MADRAPIRHHSLIIALLALIIAWGVHEFFIDDSKSQQQYSRQIMKRMHRQLNALDQQLLQVIKAIDSPASFSDYGVSVDYPYFIFENDSLIYWSDFHYVPQYAALAGTTDYNFITDKGLQFIARAGDLPDGKQVFMILPVYNSRNIQNNYIQAEFNTDIFPNGTSSVQIVDAGEGFSIVTPGGDYLFSIDISEHVQVKSRPLFYTLLALVLIAIMLLLHYVYGLTCYYLNNHQYGKALLATALGLFSIRGGMLYFDFPAAIVPLNVFDPQFYASSDLNHSLGDLFLNELVLLVLVSFVFRHYRNFEWYRTIAASDRGEKSLTVVFWLTLSLVLLYFQYHIITLFYQSQWSLDISSIMDFSFFKFLSLVIIIINAALYFMITHLAVVETQRLLGKTIKKIVVHYAVALLVFLAISLIFEWNWPVVALLSTVYLSLIYILNISAYLGQYNYTSFLYLFIGALQCAVIGAYAVNTYEKVEDINGKQQLADQLLNERDIVGEFLLSEAMEKISDDRYIVNQMLFNPFGSSEAILQKINRIYINQHLDRYDIAINLFDSRGDPDPQNDSFLRYQDYYAQYGLDSYKSDYENLFFINEITSDLLNRYLGFIEIRQQNIPVGYVIIDLKLKRVIPNTVYPELLVYNQQRESSYSGYSYAIYLQDTLINNSGSFNYAKDFDRSYFQKNTLFTKGMSAGGFHHLAARGPSGRVAVISSVAYPVRNILANFSFLFILLIFSLIFFISGFVIFRKRPVKLNYATRIQLYLNLAFFLPLLIVSITTLSLISSSSKKEVIKQYFEKADGIRNNIVNPLTDYLHDNLGDELMAQEITQIAQYSESDINLFDTKGELISTSQPKIYDYNILSERINPLALTDIVEEQNNSVLLNESVGTLSYKSAYVGIRSFGSGDLLGILSIPFFESKYELDKEIVVILTNILNIFTFIFIVILIASYFASRVLTVPLNLITQKIKKTTLTGYNEPLEWNSDDEIGLMVGEYNRMLQNLEASKTALARSEKESAWREMAQQVAHEIKNPLTPMKLTLQHLKRMLSSKDGGGNQLSEKPINSLLHQIDTLSDIATSFSSFAKMPVPENQRIEISSILRRTIQLYANSRDHEVEASIEAGNHYVMGDPQLMGRIFSNLIINGIQSVPKSRKPRIEISLKTDNNKVIVEFRDNGCGIPDKIRDKIFIPNFSTKDTGSGIGLSIAKRGIEHAGGKIWFETTTDVGTTVFVELPLVD